MTTAYANLTSGYGGKCLQWVRLALGVSAREPTAYAAWLAA